MSVDNWARWDELERGFASPVRWLWYGKAVWSRVLRRIPLMGTCHQLILRTARSRYYPPLNLLIPWYGLYHRDPETPRG
jgi:hypothetical protein